MFEVHPVWNATLVNAASRHVLAWILWWVVLFWLWMLLVGEWNATEWVSAAGAATIAATLGEVMRSIGGVVFEVPLRPVKAIGTALAMVLVDFAIVMAALVRRRRGAFVVREFEAGGEDPSPVGVRAFTMLVANISPNAYVIDIDREQNLVLLHDLVPFRKSEEPA